MVMPVATPIAKLMPNSTPQNCVMRFQISRAVMTYTDSMITRIMDRPKVSGTNRKWYSAVSANCSRERLTTSRSIMRRGHGRTAATAGSAPSTFATMVQAILAPRSRRQAAPGDSSRCVRKASMASPQVGRATAAAHGPKSSSVCGRRAGRTRRSPPYAQLTVGTRPPWCGHGPLPSGHRAAVLLLFSLGGALLIEALRRLLLAFLLAVHSLTHKVLPGGGGGAPLQTIPR